MPRRRRSLAVVELTPMIDVVFLLIVFFLVAADATRMSRPSVSLVDGPGEAPVGTHWDHVFTLQADGQWRSGREDEPVRPAQIMLKATDRVLLRTDAAAPSGPLLELAGHLRGQGIDHVEFAVGAGVAQ